MFTSRRMPSDPILHVPFCKFNIPLPQFLGLFGEGMDQNDPIPKIEKVQNPILV